jgi:hypothetical protein
MFSVLDWFGVQQGSEGRFANPLGESIRSILTEVDSTVPPAQCDASVNCCPDLNHRQGKGEFSMARYAIPRVAHCCNGSE